MRRVMGVSLLLFAMQLGQAAAQTWQYPSPNTTFNGGNVGIGLTSPGYPLEVNGPIVSTGSNNGLFFDDWPSGGKWLWYGNSGMAKLYSTVTGIAMTVDAGGVIRANGPNGALSFRDRNPAYPEDWYWYAQDGTTSLYLGGNDLLKIARTGGVTIGGAAPPSGSTKLHVAGDVDVTGVIVAKYGQDLAEWVPATGELEPGTVVVLSSSASNTVTASHTPYDVAVAGVVAERPGIVLGEAGAGMRMIATTGRVLVRADATETPIRIGDLLVTSDRTGMAMKSQPISIGDRALHQPGTILGKALQPLDTGTGRILVLLSLQ